MITAFPAMSAGIASPVMPHETRAQMELALIRDVRTDTDRFPTEFPGIDVATRRAKLRVFQVTIDKLETVHRAELDLRGKRIALVRLLRIEFSTEIADGGSEREGRSNFDFVLRAEVNRSRALDRGTDAAAFAGAVEADLHHLVVDPGSQPLCHARRVCAREHHVPRKDDADHVVERVGYLLVAKVENVERKRRGPVRLGRQDERESVAHASDGL